MGTTKLAPQTAVPLAELAESWLLALEAEHKSPATLRAYRRGVDAFLGRHGGQGSAGAGVGQPARAPDPPHLLRAGEALALTVADVDVRRGLAMVRRGKGGKGRVVPFGPETGRAVDRYLRLRRRHPLAHTAPLWLPGAGRPRFGYQGLSRTIG